MSSISRLHTYWAKPGDASNQPAVYASRTQRSEFLLQIFDGCIDRDWSILELGCNCGRNLNALREAGYRRLAGIDISTGALHYGSLTYPDLFAAADIQNSTIEQWAEAPAEWDCIFTMAVLMHLHPESEWVIEAIARAARYRIVVIEDENTAGWKHFPRGYREIFEGYGRKQIAVITPDMRHDLKGTIARVFE